MYFARLKGKLSTLGIRPRLTALFVAIFGVTLIGFCSVIYFIYVRNLEKEFDVDLYNRAVDVSQNVRVNFFGEIAVDPEILSSGGKIFPFSVGKTFVQFLDSNGKIVARSKELDQGGLPLRPEDLAKLLQSGFSFRDLKSKDIPTSLSKEKNPYRLISYLLRNPFNQGLILQIAVPKTFLTQSVGAISTLLWVGIPLTLILAAFGGLYFSRRALAPVSDIIEKAKGLGVHDLSVRMPVPRAEDELRELTFTLNDLLNRLEQAFMSQERFVSDASHELKTPLAILRGEFDLITNKMDDPQALKNFMQSASQELNYLSRVVEDLLLLARVEAGTASLALQDVRLDELAIETMSRLESLAHEKGLTTRFDLAKSGLSARDFIVRGDPDLLKSMIKNIFENAIKYSPLNGQLTIRVEDREAELRLRVDDEGPGISAEIADKIFERFYRGKATASQVSGAGLGLTIARRIAEAHRGEITVANRSPHGASFQIEIKKF